jgi:hypothetical protein
LAALTRGVGADTGIRPERPHPSRFRSGNAALSTTSSSRSRRRSGNLPAEVDAA